MSTAAPSKRPVFRSGKAGSAAAGGGSGLAGLAAVGAERPAVPLGVAGGEIPGAVVGVVRFADDLGPGRLGPLVYRVRLVGDHVGAERAWGDRGHLVAVTLPRR